MTVRVRRRGPAGKYEMWARCRDPQRWPSWLRVRRVEARGPLRTGLEGAVVSPLGVRARFEIVDVDPDRMRCIAVVRVGPWAVRLEHLVDEASASVILTASAPVALASVPVARRSLARLVAA